MFFTIHEFEKRFKSYDGSSYTINHFDQTIKISAHAPFSLLRYIKDLSWRDKIIGVAVIIFFVFFIYYVIWILCIWLIAYLLGIGVRKRKKKPVTTIIDLNNRKCIFILQRIFKKKKVVSFNEIKTIKLLAYDIEMDKRNTEKRLYGYAIQAIQQSQKNKNRSVSYDMVTVRNEPDAELLAEWFEEVVGLKTNKNKNIPLVKPKENMVAQKGIHFTKTLAGADFKPAGYEAELTDARFYKVSDNGQHTLTLWLDDLASTGYVQDHQSEYVIKRLPTDRKDRYGILNFVSFDYQVMNYKTRKQVAKLSISNVRKSWKCYDVNLSVDGNDAVYNWDFKVFKMSDILNLKDNMRYNGGLYCKDKKIVFYSKFLSSDKRGNKIDRRPRNQWEIEGLIELINVPFDPVLIAVTLYLFEMELIPMPYYYDS